MKGKFIKGAWHQDPMTPTNTLEQPMVIDLSSNPLFKFPSGQLFHIVDLITFIINNDEKQLGLLNKIKIDVCEMQSKLEDIINDNYN